MATITGTEGNDDGISNPVLSGTGGDTILGLGGDDVLSTGGWLYGGSWLPALLSGGSGNDTYSVGAAFSYAIYSTPIIWVHVFSNADIVEDASAPDAADHLLPDGATPANTTIGYSDGTITLFTLTYYGVVATGRSIRLIDNYGVDDQGGLSAGVDLVTIGGAVIDLKVANPLLSFLHQGGTGSDVLQGGATDEVIDGGDGDDSLRGGDGADLLVGAAGNDRLVGEAGDDRLEGGQGDDVLRGTAGADRLAGGAGSDRMKGNAGADVFVFAANAELDRVMDFARGVDLVDVSAVFTDFAAVLAALGSAPDGSARIVSAGTEMILAGIAASDLTASDFLFA